MPALKRPYSSDLIQAKYDERICRPVSPKRRKFVHDLDNTSPPKSNAPELATIYSLPNELLREVVLETLPPDFFLDPFLGKGPDSAWCISTKTKQAIALVCRLWYECAIDLLYKDVVFRRREQIGPFLTAISKNSRLPPLVKSVHIASHLLSPYDTYLNRIFRILPNTSHLRVGMGPMSGLELRHPHLRRSRFPHPDAGMERITHLEITDKACLENFAHNMNLFENLKFLAIPLESSPDFQPLTDVEGVVFQDLEELQVFAGAYTTLDNELLRFITKVWVCPRLRRLTIIQNNRSTTCWSGLKELLDTCGLLLETLCLTINRLGTFLSSIEEQGPRLSSSDIMAVLERCPRLQHLVLPPIDLIERPLAHPKLHHLDLWTADNGADAKALRCLFLEALFPNLKSIRLVDWALLASAGPRLPLLIPHDIVRDGEHLEWKSPGIHVQHDVGHLFRRDMDYVGGDHALKEKQPDSNGGDGDDDWDDGDSSSDYEPPDHTSYTAYDNEEGDLEMLDLDFKDDPLDEFINDRDITNHVANAFLYYQHADENMVELPRSFRPGLYVNGDPGDAVWEYSDEEYEYSDDEYDDEYQEDDEDQADEDQQDADQEDEGEQGGDQEEDGPGDPVAG